MKPIAFRNMNINIEIKSAKRFRKKMSKKEQCRECLELTGHRVKCSCGDVIIICEDCDNNQDKILDCDPCAKGRAAARGWADSLYRSNDVAKQKRAPSHEG